MSFFEDSPAPPPQQNPHSQEGTPASQKADSPPPFAEPLAGDPISYAALAPAAPPPVRNLPEDLRISWSWPHLVVFLFFGFASLIAVQTSFMVHYLPHRQLSSQREYEQFILSKPQFAIGSMVIWYALLFLFLYVTLSVLRGTPFWKSLGWKMLSPAGPRPHRSPWVYFSWGCALSIFVFIVTAKLHAPDDAPIQDIFKYRNTALLFMAMAVFVAPLVEETIFRGYLYPLMARSFGVAPGIIVTGVLFGLMHGYQLGWTLGLVSTLIVVGVIFTFVRASTGTVFASFLLHLGYNSMIALATIIGTKGFTQMPPGH